MIKIMYELQETKFLSAMNTPDVLRMTPLHRAALFNHVDVVEYLLDKVCIFGSYKKCEKKRIKEKIIYLIIW